MKKHLLLLLGALVALPALARDFTYTYEGQTITYTVIDEEAKTCKTKEGKGQWAGNRVPGNNVYGNLILPKNPLDEGIEFTLIEISSDAFSGLTSISIPNSVKSIGAYAFANCSNLTKAEFSSIEHLCSVIFNGSESNPLYYAKHLFIAGKEVNDVIIPNSVKSIGNDAFAYCSGITSVTIPSSVTYIGERAFLGCSNLASITIPNSVKSINLATFSKCTSLKSVTIPNSVTQIGSNAFASCSGLTSVTIPNSVTYIGASAFNGCSGLTSLSIPNSVNSIDSWAFGGCSRLTNISIPNSVKSIGYRAFMNCTALYDVSIGNSITSIGDNAFLGCTKLHNIKVRSTKVAVSYSSGIFSECKNIQSILLVGGFEMLGSLDSNTKPRVYTLKEHIDKVEVYNYRISQCIAIPGIAAEEINSGYNFIEASIKPDSGVNITEIKGNDTVYTRDKQDILLEDLIPGQSYEITVTFSNGYCDDLQTILEFKTLPMFQSVTLIESTHCSLKIQVKLAEDEQIKNSSLNGERCDEDGIVTLTDLIPDVQYTVIATADYAGKTYSSTDNHFRTQSIFKSFELVEATQSTLTVKVSTVEDDKIKNLSVNGMKCDKNGIATITGLRSNESHSLQAKAEYKDIKCSLSNSFTTAKINPTIEAVTSPTAITLTPSSTGDAIIDRIEFSVNGEKCDAEAQTLVNLPVNSTVKADFRVNNESDSKTFTLPALELKTLAARAASKDCAIICAETNMSEEEYGGGFEWRRYDAPDMVPSTFVPCPVANGHLEGRLKGLSSSTYYKYRPYYEDCNGTRTFGEWTAFITADADVYFEPTVYTYAPNSVTKNSAKVVGYAMGGSEDINEQGFEYWSVAGSRADVEVKKVLVSGQRMIVSLTDLAPSTTYKVRAFAATATKTTYGAEQEFTTADDPDAGIEETVTEVSEAELFDIYTLSGVCVRRQTNDFSGLQRGIYIANGRKIYVR